MKKYYILFAPLLAINLLSCHSHTTPTSAGEQGVVPEVSDSTIQMKGSDTTGFAAFKVQQQKNYEDSIKLIGINEERRREGKQPLITSPAAASVVTSPGVSDSSNIPTSNTNSSSAGSNTTSGASTTNATSIPTIRKKKGMSNATKDGLIGAGAGALTGALVTKHKRGVGALVGAAAGGGAGYLIGHSKDKKQSN
ncbi:MULTISPECIES: glycine zipper domain-containing protein [Chitinophagaceae]